MDKCKYSKMRIHSTDLRPFKEITKMIGDIRNYRENEGLWSKFKQDNKEIISRLSKITTCDAYADYLISIIDSDPFTSKNQRVTKKQMESANITVDNLKHMIIQVCKDDTHDTMGFFNKFVSILKNDKPPANSNENNYIYTLQIAMYHDIYTFLRMMRTFKKVKNGEQRNIIFYGGNLHVKNLEILLEYTGFVKVFTSTPITDTCIGVDVKNNIF